MRKIYVYGYLNRLQSTRRLEQEARRNLELMWLVVRLAPDFKPLAEVRAGNTAAIKSVCREFIVLCRRWQLFTESTVAIDGSKFEAVNHRDRNFTSGKMKTRMALIERRIAEYLMHLDRMDRKETPRNPRKSARLQERIATLKEEMARLKGLKRRMEASPDRQLTLTDPDARSVANQGKGTCIVGHNVQTAVDTKRSARTSGRRVRLSTYPAVGARGRAGSHVRNENQGNPAHDRGATRLIAPGFAI